MHVVRERAITRRVETSARISGHVIIVSAIWRKRSRKRKEIGNISSSAIAGCWSIKSETKRRSNRPKKGDRRDSDEASHFHHSTVTLTESSDRPDGRPAAIGRKNAR